MRLWVSSKPIYAPTKTRPPSAVNMVINYYKSLVCNLLANKSFLNSIWNGFPGSAESCRTVRLSCSAHSGIGSRAARCCSEAHNGRVPVVFGLGDGNMTFLLAANTLTPSRCRWLNKIQTNTQNSRAFVQHLPVPNWAFTRISVALTKRH